MAKKPRNELEILTQIETYRKAIERSRASVLQNDEISSLGQLQQVKWEAMIETLNWVLAQPEPARLTEGTKVEVILYGTIVDVSNSHGPCYEINIPAIGNFANRTIWVNANEVEELT